MKAGIAFIGCGYAADLYMPTLSNWLGELELRGAFDLDRTRMEAFCAHYGLKAYTSYEEVLADPEIAIVVNLTNPAAHFDVISRALMAGKHVYTEKPLSLEFEKAQALVDLAREHHLRLASAPCNLLGESCQTAWHQIRAGRIGRPRLIYAELDCGMTHKKGCESWRSESQAPWPVEDEFETGCSMEHAGYALGWLCAIFGPARRVTSFAAALMPDKSPATSREIHTPDFSVGCVEFDDGVVARITNSHIASRDLSMRFIGEEGTLVADNCCDYASAVYLQTYTEGRIPRQFRRWVGRFPRRRLRGQTSASFAYAKYGERMDFARGVAELAQSVRENRPCRLSAELALHINELAIALTEGSGETLTLRSSFEPIAPGVPVGATSAVA